MDAGKLVPDQVLLDIIQDSIKNPDCDAGYLLDGFPRTLPQANGLDSVLTDLEQRLNIVIVIDVDDDIIVQRMSGRRVHIKSGRVYHLQYNPPKIDNIDDITGE